MSFEKFSVDVLPREGEELHREDEEEYELEDDVDHRRHVDFRFLVVGFRFRELHASLLLPTTYGCGVVLETRTR
jgi:hypothetical protein